MRHWRRVFNATVQRTTDELRVNDAAKNTRAASYNQQHGNIRQDDKDISSPHRTNGLDLFNLDRQLRELRPGKERAFQRLHIRSARVSVSERSLLIAKRLFPSSTKEANGSGITVPAVLLTAVNENALCVTGGEIFLKEEHEHDFLPRNGAELHAENLTSSSRASL